VEIRENEDKKKNTPQCENEEEDDKHFRWWAEEVVKYHPLNPRFVDIPTQIS
jgi:hypothetical protein